MDKNQGKTITLGNRGDAMNDDINIGSSQSCSKSVKILVSVREISELQSILSIGVDVIDFKDPSGGALAATSPTLWRLVADEFIDSGASPGSKWSVALGESDSAIELAGRCPRQFDFAKAGPSRMRETATLMAMWQSVRRRLHDDVELVAVAYADHVAAVCPDPMQILDAANRFGLRTILLDTEGKAGGGLTTLMGHRDLERFVRTADQLGMRCLLAGSLSLDSAVELARQTDPRPFGIGLRGGLCHGGRDQPIDPRRVTQLRQRIRCETSSPICKVAAQVSQKRLRRADIAE